MEWKYPYVKRALTDDEKDALVGFVTGISLLVLASAVFLKEVDYPSLRISFILLCATWGLLQIYKGYVALKETDKPKKVKKNAAH